MKGLILLTFLSALLVFGCIVGESTEEVTPETTAEEGTGGEEVTTEEPTGTAEEVSEEEPPEEGTNDLAGLEFAAIMALGIPVECDIDYTYMGQPTTYKLYMDSGGAMSARMELDEGSSTMNCSAMLMVSKDNTVYMGCEGQKYYMSEVCDWLSMEISEEGDDGPVQISDPTEDLGELPASDIDCRPWIYDQSKFATPGTVCTMEEYSDELMSAYQ